MNAIDQSDGPVPDSKWTASRPVSELASLICSTDRLLADLLTFMSVSDCRTRMCGSWAAPRALGSTWGHHTRSRSVTAGQLMQACWYEVFLSFGCFFASLWPHSFHSDTLIRLYCNVRNILRQGWVCWFAETDWRQAFSQACRQPLNYGGNIVVQFEITVGGLTVNRRLRRSLWQLLEFPLFILWWWHRWQHCHAIWTVRT